jgi:hypothetical protein
VSPRDEELDDAIVEAATDCALDALLLWAGGDHSRLVVLAVADAIGAILEVGADPAHIVEVLPRDLRALVVERGGGPGEPYVVSADRRYAAQQLSREARSVTVRELAVAYLRGLS